MSQHYGIFVPADRKALFLAILYNAARKKGAPEMTCRQAQALVEKLPHATHIVAINGAPIHVDFHEWNSNDIVNVWWYVRAHSAIAEELLPILRGIQRLPALDELKSPPIKIKASVTADRITAAFE